MFVEFHFSGGPLDGKTVEGEASGQDEAARYYALTNHGTVGQRFRIGSEYAIETLARELLQEEATHHFQRHTYIVTHRDDSDDGILLRAEYIPPQESAAG